MTKSIFHPSPIEVGPLGFKEPEGKASRDKLTLWPEKVGNALEVPGSGPFSQMLLIHLHNDSLIISVSCILMYIWKYVIANPITILNCLLVINNNDSNRLNEFAETQAIENFSL